MPGVLDENLDKIQCSMDGQFRYRQLAQGPDSARRIWVAIASKNIRTGKELSKIPDDVVNFYYAVYLLSEESDALKLVGYDERDARCTASNFLETIFDQRNFIFENL